MLAASAQRSSLLDVPGQLAGHRLWKPTVRVLSDKCDNIVRAPANHRQRALHELHAIELAKAYALASEAFQTDHLIDLARFCALRIRI